MAFVGDADAGGCFAGEEVSFEGDVDFDGEFITDGAVPGLGPSRPGMVPDFVGDAAFPVIDDLGPPSG